MKTKIIIGLLSLGVVGTGSYAIVENNVHAKELSKANETIVQYSEELENKDTSYNDLLNKITDLETNYNELSEIINNLNYDEDIENINTKISTINKNISSLSNEVKKSQTSELIGKWKYIATENTYDENGNVTDTKTTEYIYEFKEDGKIYIDNKIYGSFNEGAILIYTSSEIVKMGCLYEISNNKLLLYAQVNATHNYYALIRTLEKI